MLRELCNPLSMFFANLNVPATQLQLIEIFVSGLNRDELKMTILRRNPQTFDEASGIATSEAILRQKISAGNRVSADRNLGPEPMEVDPMRG